MALGTHIVNRRVPEHMFIFRTMGPVTTRARDYGIIVPRVKRRRSHRMGRMFRIIVTSLAQIDRRRLPEQEYIVRSMRGMTSCTLTVIDWFMFRRRTFLLLDDIGVTLSAQLDLLGLQEWLFRRRMRVMAVETACFIGQGPMDTVLHECIIDHCAVAASAQLKSFPFGGKGRLRRRLLMALVAHSVRYGTVHIGKQDSSTIRAMGIMTARATTFGDWIIHVLLFERRVLGLVAGKAECRNGIFQQMCGLTGRVRIVTVDAPLLHREVLEFHVFYHVSHLAVAAETKIVSRRKEVIFVFGRVRIMAFDAISFRRDPVDTDGTLGNDVGMTGEADLVGIRCQQLPMRRVMGVMAARTVAVLNGGMYRWHLDLVLKIDMTG